MSEVTVVRCKATDAQAVYCPECDETLGCQYWGPRQTMGLHRRGCPNHHPFYVCIGGV